MLKRFLTTIALALAVANTVGAQPTTKPLPPIDTVAGLLVVGVAEFASLPPIDTIAARPMLLIDERGTRRLFVNDMRGPIYSVSYDGKRVTKYVDTNDSTWGVNVQAQGRERGMQSFAFHPDFARTGTPGYGKFYTWADSSLMMPPADALQMLLKGEQLKVDRAKAMKLVDAVVPPADLIKTAKEWIKAGGKGVAPWDVQGFKLPGGAVRSPIANRLIFMAAET